MLRAFVIALLAGGCIQDLHLETLTFTCTADSDCLEVHRCDPSGFCVPKDAPIMDGGVEPKVEVLEIAAGDRHTCVLIRGGEVRCFGDNSEGELGIGTTDVGTEVPTKVMGLGPAKQIGAGVHHTCALEENGDVRCWGYSGFGQSGPPYAGSVPLPSDPIVTGAVELAIGSYQTSCARLMSGEVKCWGLILDGTGYNVDPREGSMFPRTMPLGFEVHALAVGSYHLCATDPERRVHCLGNNINGQLGVESSSTALPLDVGLTADRIALGDLHSCVIDGGRIFCWGLPLAVDGGPGFKNTRAIAIDIGGVAVELGLGRGHTCARFGNDAIRCWGSVESGAAGENEGEGNYREPGPIEGIDGERALRLFGGWAHSCAILENGDASCWGANRDGQLGRLPRAIRVPIAAPIDF